MVQLPEIFEAAAHQVMSNLDLALDLARQGVHVFPCQPDGADEKKPCPGVFWRNSSTTNETRIRQWWDRWPDALPGIDLAKAGFVVIDCDRKPGQPDGVTAFHDLATRHDDALEGVPIVETANGGQHHYFRQWAQHGNGKGALPPGIDVRGHGGYVIAPGATFLDGRRYEPTEGDFQDAKDAPAWLIDVLSASKPEREMEFRSEPTAPVSDDRKRTYGRAALDEEAHKVETCGRGGRNNLLNEAAFACGQLVAGGCLSEPEVRSALVSAATACGLVKDDGLRSVQNTISSGLKAGAREPRGPPVDSGTIITLAPRYVIETPDGTLADAETGEIIEPATPTADEDYPDAALRVGGLIGEIADWIMATSMFPSRLFATAAAMAVIGTAVGRQVYTGVPRAGTSLYWLTIAPTAGGKERPQEAIRQILAAANIGRMAKPSCASSAKLGMSLHQTPSQIQIIDEVGKVLRRFVARHSSSQEMALLDDYCSIWGKNTGTFSPEGVTVRSDVTIQRPALTFFGATTPSAFFEQLRAKQVAGGFLNRFIVLQRFNRSPVNTDVIPDDEVPASIVEGVKSLHTFQDCIVNASNAAVDMPDMPPPLFIVPADEGGEKALEEYRAKAWEMILKADQDPIYEVYARAAEIVKRMALILACGRHWQDMSQCRITAADVRFASGLVDWSMSSFVEKLRENMAENEHQANTKAVLGIIRKAGSIKRNELVRKLDGRLDARAFDGIMKMLAEGGVVEAVQAPPGPKGGRPSTTYYFRGRTP